MFRRLIVNIGWTKSRIMHSTALTCVRATKIEPNLFDSESFQIFD